MKIDHEREIVALKEYIRQLRSQIKRQAENNLELSRAANASYLMYQGQENWVDCSNRIWNNSQLERSCRQPHSPNPHADMRKSVALPQWEGGSRQLHETKISSIRKSVNVKGWEGVSKELASTAQRSQQVYMTKDELREAIKATKRSGQGGRDLSQSISIMGAKLRPQKV